MSAADAQRHSRRGLLLAGLCLLGGATLVALPRTRRTLLSLPGRLWGARRSPAQKLMAHFHYLEIAPELAERYVEDYRAHVRDIGRLDYAGDDFYSRFLLSTDFFQNGGDESRTLSYVALYGPMITLCYNPLARLE